MEKATMFHFFGETLLLVKLANIMPYFQPTPPLLFSHILRSMIDLARITTSGRGERS